MRVFAFEFFSGGGLLGQPLPPGLAREGDLMLAALVRDLAELPGIAVVTTRDPRLPPLRGCEILWPRPGEDPYDLYGRGLAAADAAWPTAAEAGGVLERLARQTVSAGRMLLGCRPEAVRLAASKRATARALEGRGVPVVPTIAPGEPAPDVPGPWVVKPDDGAGCEGTEILADRHAALELIGRVPGLVAQPWLEGEPLSLSLLCREGTAALLSCNRQRIAVRDGRVTLEGVAVNAVADTDGRFARLGRNVAAAIPGLWGYVGVDLLVGPGGPSVLEINPRLTTSFAGLRPSLGLNAAALVLGLVGAEDPVAGVQRGSPGVAAEIRLEPSLA